ncbi:hypothetical protein [Streptomyces sp. NPDC057509]|uniref:hypothetical protein n=1 Tax=Streptomyces sp. NPDC057509 TaxID=3346152 RepID=UPI0036B8047F
MTTPATELRAAAALLRDKATEAVHEGRTTWSTGNTLGSRSPVVVDDQEQPSVLIETFAARLERVNSYLTLVGPATGLALADWLDTMARNSNDEGAAFLDHALAVARQVLGTPTTDTVAADRLREAAQRALESLNALIADTTDPGVEALGARHELGQALLNTSLAPASAPAAPADRAAVLREAADIAETLRQFEPAYGPRKDAQVSENVGVLRVADHFRRLADEAQPTEAHPTETEWVLETLWRTTGKWRRFGPSRATRHEADQDHERAVTQDPSRQYRIVRAVTTSTIAPATTATEEPQP